MKVLVQQATDVEQDARAIAANLSGSIRFGCFHTIAPFYLSQLIKAYRLDHSQINLLPFEMQQDEIERSILADEIDVALTYDMGLDSEKFDLQQLDQLKPFILLSKGHALADNHNLSLKQMAQEPFIMFDGPSSRNYFRNILDQADIDPPIAFNATSMESARSAVANQLGFSLSVMRPKHKFTYDGGELVSIPIADEIIPISLVLARKKSRDVSPLINQFITFCKGHYIFEKSL